MTGSAVHPTAIISEKATIETNVSIGPYTIIHDDVIIKAGTRIGSHCEIGIPSPTAKTAELIIGQHAHIRSHCVFYQGSVFQDNLVTGHYATVRENTIAGKAFQIGSYSDIQGDCEIGDYVRTQSNVFIGKNSTLGSFIWLFPYAALTNDPHPPSEVMIGPIIKDYAILAAKALILPGVVIHEHALVAAGSVVKEDVPAHMLCAGVPAKTIGPASRIKLTTSPDQPAYPWTAHFHRGYPQEMIDSWKNNPQGSE